MKVVGLGGKREKETLYICFQTSIFYPYFCVVRGRSSMAFVLEMPIYKKAEERGGVVNLFLK